MLMCPPPDLINHRHGYKIISRLCEFCEGGGKGEDENEG